MVVEVKVKPMAKDDRLVRFHQEGLLEVELKAKPEKNQANERLIAFLAKFLGVDPKGIKIIKGQKERKKLLKIDGITERDFWQRLKG